MVIPIFIITRDRVSCLKQCIEGYKKLGKIEIVIHDNGSTYPPMIEYLSDLEQQGIKVYRNVDSNDFKAISNNVSSTIQDWYTTKSSKYYIVTDPDIELESPSPDLLQYYQDALERHPQATCASPMLRIDDIPDHFAFKETMIKSHMIQFWDKSHLTWLFKEVKIQFAAVDTTFAMYRKSFRFKRLNRGVRIHEPYMAKHLDWYIDTENITDEQKYYSDNASTVSTLSNYIKQGYMG